MNKIQFMKGSSANIRLSVWEPRWPQQCACCYGDNDTTLEIEIKDVDADGRILYQRSWRVPYCAQCKLHVERAQSMTFNTFLGPKPSLGTLFALMASLALGLLFESAIPLILVIAIVLFVILRHHRRGVLEGKEIMKAECCCVGPSVIGLSHHQYKGDIHTFRFKNAQYAAAFKQLNNVQELVRFVS